MALPVSNRSERTLAITRVIMIYFILLCCSLIPAYYLFNIPDIASLNVKSGADENGKKDKEILENYCEKMGILDKLYDAKKVDVDFQTAYYKLNEFTVTKVDSTNAYWVLFKQIPVLYDRILKTNDNCTYKTKFEETNLELQAKKTQIEDLQKQLETLKAAKPGG
jgi:hypothetical protein